MLALDWCYEKRAQDESPSSDWRSPHKLLRGPDRAPESALRALRPRSSVASALCPTYRDLILLRSLRAIFLALGEWVQAKVGGAGERAGSQRAGTCRQVSLPTRPDSVGPRDSRDRSPVRASGRLPPPPPPGASDAAAPLTLPRRTRPVTVSARPPRGSGPGRPTCRPSHARGQRPARRQRRRRRRVPAHPSPPVPRAAAALPLGPGPPARSAAPAPRGSASPSGRRAHQHAGRGQPRRPPGLRTPCGADRRSGRRGPRPAPRGPAPRNRSAQAQQPGPGPGARRNLRRARNWMFS
uniref:basic proline-rich protein-like n=1 Tax=Callithrix jacchus TaxID=9483 RepID=UPI0023DD4B92|nr:basic proline-rich protein-like [Callithrix jacchus]